MRTNGEAVCYGFAPFITGDDGGASSVVGDNRFSPLRFVELSATQFVTCGVTGESKLFCWGSSQGNWLGAPASQYGYAVAVQLESGQTLADARTAVPGLAVTRAGELYRWGNAEPWARKVDGISNAVQVTQGYVLLRDGKALKLTDHGAEPVPGLEDAVEVQGGNQYACARRRSGEVVCWGSNGDGQLGDGTIVSREEPAPVVGLF